MLKAIADDLWSQYRCNFSHVRPPKCESAELTIVTDGHCLLYVNGQRILKNVSLEKSGGSVAALGFDVRSLLRQGRNTVAVEVHSADKVALLGIAISAVQGERRSAVGGMWRMTSIAPPVSWQQTDFNDRDWIEAIPVNGDPADRFTVAVPEKFAAPVIPTKGRTAPFQFEDGDHVVFVGATFFERSQLSEHLEATLAGTCGDKHVTFRNLGWSADTLMKMQKVSRLRLPRFSRATRSSHLNSDRFLSRR